MVLDVNSKHYHCTATATWSGNCPIAVGVAAGAGAVRAARVLGNDAAAAVVPQQDADRT